MDDDLALSARLEACRELLPAPLRELDLARTYRILQLDSAGGFIPPELVDSAEMLALEAAGLMHAVYRENYHVGVSIEQFHGYRGDAGTTELLNRLNAAIGAPSVTRQR